MVKFTQIPNMKTRLVGQSVAEQVEDIKNIEDTLAMGLIRWTAFEPMYVFANSLHYAKTFHFGEPVKVNDGKVKTWYTTADFTGVFVEQGANGAWVVEPNVDSVYGLQFATRELRDFYNTYRSHFPFIPKFVVKNIPFEEASRMQFGDGPGEAFPIAKVLNFNEFKTQFPPDIAFRVKDGNLEWFKISEYKKEFPVNITVTLTPVVQIPNEVILMTVQMILMDENKSIPAKVLALKDLFGAKPQVLPSPAPAI